MRSASITTGMGGAAASQRARERAVEHVALHGRRLSRRADVARDTGRRWRRRRLHRREDVGRVTRPLSRYRHRRAASQVQRSTDEVAAHRRTGCVSGTRTTPTESRLSDRMSHSGPRAPAAKRVRAVGHEAEADERVREAQVGQQRRCRARAEAVAGRRADAVARGDTCPSAPPPRPARAASAGWSRGASTPRHRACGRSSAAALRPPRARCTRATRRRAAHVRRPAPTGGRQVTAVRVAPVGRPAAPGPRAASGNASDATTVSANSVPPTRLPRRPNE
jgi:hypothetical protein